MKLKEYPENVTNVSELFCFVPVDIISMVFMSNPVSCMFLNMPKNIIFFLHLVNSFYAKMQ